MPASHLEFHVEERSMEAFLTAWLPRIERLKVRNFRARREVELKNLTPLTTGGASSRMSCVHHSLAYLSVRKRGY